MTKPTRIIHARREIPYFISARQAPQDRTLSWEARGVLWYLLSKPDDWIVQPKDLEQGCGHSKVYKLLRELRVTRYLKMKTERDDKSRIVGYIYEVYETPYTDTEGEIYPVAKKQQAGKQLAGKQLAGKQHLTEYRVLQNTEKAVAAASEPERANIFRLFEDLCGMSISPLVYQDLKDVSEHFPADWIEDAFKEAAISNVRNWKYVLAILKRWEKEGRGALKTAVTATPEQAAESAKREAIRAAKAAEFQREYLSTEPAK